MKRWDCDDDDDCDDGFLWTCKSSVDCSMFDERKSSFFPVASLFLLEYSVDDSDSTHELHSPFWILISPGVRFFPILDSVPLFVFFWPPIPRRDTLPVLPLALEFAVVVSVVGSSNFFAAASASRFFFNASMIAFVVVVVVDVVVVDVVVVDVVIFGCPWQGVALFILIQANIGTGSVRCILPQDRCDPDSDSKGFFKYPKLLGDSMRLHWKVQRSTMKDDTTEIHIINSNYKFYPRHTNSSSFSPL